MEFFIIVSIAQAVLVFFLSVMYLGGNNFNPKQLMVVCLLGGFFFWVTGLAIGVVFVICKSFSWFLNQFE